MSNGPMLLLLACAAHQPPPVPEATPPQPPPVPSRPPPAVVHVRFEQEVRTEALEPLDDGRTTFHLVSTWRGTETRTSLGPTRLPDGVGASTIPVLRCVVLDGKLTVVQLPDGPYPEPMLGWCGPPMRTGSVLFRVEVDEVTVFRLQ